MPDPIESVLYTELSPTPQEDRATTITVCRKEPETGRKKVTRRQRVRRRLARADKEKGIKKKAGQAGGSITSIITTPKVRTPPSTRLVESTEKGAGFNYERLNRLYSVQKGARGPFVID